MPTADRTFEELLQRLLLTMVLFGVALVVGGSEACQQDVDFASQSSPDETITPTETPSASETPDDGTTPVPTASVDQGESPDPSLTDTEDEGDDDDETDDPSTMGLLLRSLEGANNTGSAAAHVNSKKARCRGAGADGNWLGQSYAERLNAGERKSAKVRSRKSRCPKSFVLGDLRTKRYEVLNRTTNCFRSTDAAEKAGFSPEFNFQRPATDDNGRYRGALEALPFSNTCKAFYDQPSISMDLEVLFSNRQGNASGVIGEERVFFDLSNYESEVTIVSIVTGIPDLKVGARHSLRREGAVQCNGKTLDALLLLSIETPKFDPHLKSGARLVTVERTNVCIEDTPCSLAWSAELTPESLD